MTADLSAAELDTLAQFEAADDAPEALRERMARALAKHTELHGLPPSHFCSCGWKGDRWTHHLADVALDVVRPPADSPGDSAEKASAERCPWITGYPGRQCNRVAGHSNGHDPDAALDADSAQGAGK